MSCEPSDATARWARAGAPLCAEEGQRGTPCSSLRDCNHTSPVLASPVWRTAHACPYGLQAHFCSCGISVPELARQVVRQRSGRTPLRGQLCVCHGAAERSKWRDRLFGRSGPTPRPRHPAWASGTQGRTIHHVAMRYVSTLLSRGRVGQKRGRDQRAEQHPVSGKSGISGHLSSIYFQRCSRALESGALEPGAPTMVGIFALLAAKGR